MTLIAAAGGFLGSAIGAGTLSIRTRGTPAGFNLIEADAQTVNVTALGWNGAAFETYRAWPLPRR